jgi:hypothetical protein
VPETRSHVSGCFHDLFGGYGQTAPVVTVLAAAPEHDRSQLVPAPQLTAHDPVQRKWHVPPSTQEALLLAPSVIVQSELLQWRLLLLVADITQLLRSLQLSWQEFPQASSHCEPIQKK